MLTLCLAACNEGRDTSLEASGLAADSIKRDTTLALLSEKDAPLLHISLNIKCLKSGKYARQINDTLLRGGVLRPDYFSLRKDRLTAEALTDSFLVLYCREWQAAYQPLYRLDRENKSSYSISYDVRTEATCPVDDILEYTAYETSLMGGDHEMRQRIIQHFNLKNGLPLRLDDIFVSGFEKPLSQAIAEQMQEERNAESFSDLQQKHIFEGIDPYAPDNFSLESGKITFIYFQSEIAPEAMGEICVTLKMKNLFSLMRRHVYEMLTKG